MKKLIVGLLMTAMICSLAACGGKNQSSAGTDTSAVGETAENADSSASSEDVVAYQAGTWDGVTYKYKSWYVPDTSGWLADRYTGAD